MFKELLHKDFNLNYGLAISLSVFISLMGSCTFDEIAPFKIPEPRVPVEIPELDVSFTKETPKTINSLYWTTADFRLATVDNLQTGLVPTEDGLFNMNGTFNGLTDFNEGTDAGLKIQAAYDDESIYILATWLDINFDMSSSSWVYDGPTDPLKAGSTDGWTSQRNDDNIIFEFDMGGGKKDVWKWSLALSEPLGYAIDMIDNGTGAVSDTGDKIFARNENVAGNNRSGPKYQWNGEQQELTRELGGFTILDPGFYLLNKMPFEGDVVKGEVLYQKKGECYECHGLFGEGNGEFGDGTPFNIGGGFNRFTSSAFDVLASAGGHDGSDRWNRLTATEKIDLTARIRGFTGIPGYYLENPAGSNSDVLAVSNVKLAKINPFEDNESYSVLFVRKLNTGNTDDIQFTISTAINFNVYLTDNDDLNTIGAANETLTLK
jgi:mono/diheme cytochrome c family protein